VSHRIWFIARLTLTEAFRQRFLTVIVLLGIAMIAGARALGTFDFGSSELKFTADLGFGAITFFGTILAVAMTSQLFFAELECRTALTLLARPVRRAEFIFGKFLGIVFSLLAFVALMTLILIIILAWRGGVLGSSDAIQAPRISAVGLVGFVLALKLALTATITLFFCSFSRTQLFSVVVAFLAVLICHLQYLAQDAWRETGSWFIRGVAWVFAVGLPNFQVYSLGDAAADGQIIPMVTVGLVLAYTGFYVMVFQVLSWVCFEKREI
jgi:ABC-type transport system involved in multi-copper enzyme maturation permease subunit